MSEWSVWEIYSQRKYSCKPPG